METFLSVNKILSRKREPEFRCTSSSLLCCSHMSINFEEMICLPSCGFSAQYLRISNKATVLKYLLELIQFLNTSELNRFQFSWFMNAAALYNRIKSIKSYKLKIVP